MTTERHIPEDNYLHRCPMETSSVIRPWFSVKI